MPILMINGKKDHLAPIGNIYFMLENGPALGREARIYPDAGHCAFKYFSDWAPASFRWLKEKLNSNNLILESGKVGNENKYQNEPSRKSEICWV